MWESSGVSMKAGPFVLLWPVCSLRQTTIEIHVEHKSMQQRDIFEWYLMMEY